MINDEVAGLKASAKDLRRSGDWDLAIADLEDALAILMDLAPDEPSDATQSVAAEIADTYGMIGGVERRWALGSTEPERSRHLRASLDAYEKGFDYEEQFGAEWATTYNRINRVVAQALVDPDSLNHANPAMTAALRATEEIVIGQLDASRMKDSWAYCDLLMIRLLLGDSSAISTIALIVNLRPPAFVYDSTLQTLEPLAAAVSNQRPEFVEAVHLLRRAMRQAG